MALTTSIVIAVLALGAAQLPRAQFLERYVEGLQEVRLENWQTVTVSMRAAIAEQPRERARLPLRRYFRPYIPHYYLGVALFNLGDCAAAKYEWDLSESYGVISDRAEGADVVLKRRECEQRRAARSELRAAISAAIEAGRRRAAAVDSLLPAQSPTWLSGSPSFADKRRRVDEDLNDLQAELDRPASDRDSESLRRVLDTAGAVAKRIAALDRDLRASLASATEQVAALQSEIFDLAEEGRRALRSTAYLAPYPRRVADRRETLDALLRAESGGQSPTDIPALQERRAQLIAATKDLGEVAAPPPRILLRAAEAHFEGRYLDAVGLLEGRDPASRRARAHARLLLSASRYKLWIEGGAEEDSQLLILAGDDARAALEADPRLVPLPSLFSPAFRAFFDKAGAEDAAPR